MRKEKRNKMIFVGAILVGILSFTACTQPKEEKVVVHKEEEASPEPDFSEKSEISDVRKELEKLYEKPGNRNSLSDTQPLLLSEKYDVPVFDDFPQEYFFEDRMDWYLTELKKIAKQKEEYDFLYNAISERLINDYQTYKKELSEKDCERFLEIINLCKKRLKTAEVWEEPEEEPQEKVQEETKENPTKEIKLTDTRKKLERIYKERGNYNPRSGRETDFLWSNYDIPTFIKSSEKSFKKCFNSYLDKMEKLAKKRGEYDLLYEDVSDTLIWEYDYYREKLTEEQCQQILKVIKLCKKRMKSAKTLYK